MRRAIFIIMSIMMWLGFLGTITILLSIPLWMTITMFVVSFIYIAVFSIMEARREKNVIIEAIMDGFEDEEIHDD